MYRKMVTSEKRKRRKSVCARNLVESRRFSVFASSKADPVRLIVPTVSFAGIKRCRRYRIARRQKLPYTIYIYSARTCVLIKRINDIKADPRATIVFERRRAYATGTRLYQTSVARWISWRYFATRDGPAPIGIRKTFLSLVDDRRTRRCFENIRKRSRQFLETLTISRQIPAIRDSGGPGLRAIVL